MLRKTDHGLMVFSDPEADKPIREVQMLQCVHCGMQFPARPTKGRGFCLNCCGPVCGERCKECIPQDLMLENMEKGRPWDYKVVIA